MYKITRKELREQNPKFLEKCEKDFGKFLRLEGIKFQDGRIVELFEFETNYCLGFLNPESPVREVPINHGNVEVYYKKIFDFRRTFVPVTKEAFFALMTLYAIKGQSIHEIDEARFLMNITEQDGQDYING